jgi:hypothetical protein
VPSMWKQHGAQIALHKDKLHPFQRSGGPLLYHTLIVRLSPLGPNESSARPAWCTSDDPVSTAQDGWGRSIEGWESAAKVEQTTPARDER